MGAMQELHLTGGAFLDIGGASTEIVTFEDGTPVDFASFPIGSLSLYRRCVKKILPGDGSLKRLRQEISKTIDISDGALARGRCSSASAVRHAPRSNWRGIIAESRTIAAA